MPSDNSESIAPEPEASTGDRVQPDDGQQEERRRLIQELIDRGIFAKTGYNGGSLPKVWVTSAFLGLDEEQQNQFLSVVYAYYAIVDDDFGVGEDALMRSRLVVKIDNGSALGRRIGEYEPFEGFRPLSP